MGLFTYTVAGGGFMVIGGWESFVSASGALAQSQLSTSSSESSPLSARNVNRRFAKTSSVYSTVTFLSISVLALLAVVNSLLSLFDAIKLRDKTGLALQLEVISVSLLFLLYSGLGILTKVRDSSEFPLAVLNLICAFAFGEEFLLFYVHSKDPNGIENRYYDLFLVPVAICLFSTIIELKSPKSHYPRLGRGIGLVLQGMWILQMGFSFYSNLIANGCALHEKSRGNYTVRCKGHPEYHRGRAVATLQFNCHLAILVTLLASVFSLVCKNSGIRGEFMRYKPIGDGEGQDDHAHFSLETDDEDDNQDRANEAGIVEMQKPVVAAPVSAVNGQHLHS